MDTTGRHDDAKVIADLNDLLQLDHDAVQAYTIAINLARDGTIRDTLVEYRADHKRHIEELAGLIRDRGGLPLEMPHPTGALKLAVQTLGSLPSDEALLLAFKAVEGQARDKYRRFARNTYTEDVAKVVERAAEDEERHYSWCESELSRRGVGMGTLPHGIARIVEGIHKAIADPVEGLGRKLTEGVGRSVGTTRTRGGSEAPSPADVASGMAASSADRDGMTGARRDPADLAADALDVDERGGDRARRGDPLRSEPAVDDLSLGSPIVGPSGRPAREELRDELEGRPREDLGGR